MPASSAVDLVLQQRLAEAGHVAVPEDAEGAREELGALAVVFDVLVAEEANGGLRDGESHGGFGVGGLLGLLRRGGNHGQAPRWVVQGQAGIDGLVVPGAAQPGVLGVVDDLPGAFGARVRPSR